MPSSIATAGRPDVLTADDRLLRAAASFFAVAVLIHNADHLRRGVDSIGADVFWVGTAAIVIEVIPVVLVFMRHRVAPLAAVAAGFPLAVGYLVVHFTPQRSWLSDALPGGGVDALTWFAASLETIAALCLGIAGLVVIRHRGLEAGAPRIHSAATGDDGSSDSLAQALRQPIVAAMVAGNVVILVASLLAK